MKLTPRERIENALNKYSLWTDDELYILKRALVEASKYIYMEEKMSYTQEELDLFDSLLVEAIDNIKARELIEKNVLRYTEERKKEKKNGASD